MFVGYVPGKAALTARRHPSATETRVVRKLDLTSRDYLRDLKHIQELRLAQIDFREFRMPEMSSSRLSTERMAKRQVVTSLSKVTKHTCNILDVIHTTEREAMKTSQLQRNILGNN